LHQPEIHLPAFFGNFLGAPEKKNPLMTSPYDLFFFTILGGVGTMFASFCWEMYDAFNTQRSKLWNYTLLFFIRTTTAIGELFLCVVFLFAGVFKKQRFYCEAPYCSTWSIKNHKY